jgi:nitroreductase
MFSDELYRLIKSRRSIRNWTNEQVPDWKLRKIMEAGLYAPSACGSAKIKLNLIKDEKLIQQICQNTSDWFKQNYPNAIVVVYFDLSKDDNMRINYGTPHKYWSRFIWQDSAACMQNMILMAEAVEVKSCWVSHRPDRQGIHEVVVKHLLNIPDHYILTSFLYLGYSTQKVDYEKDTHQGNRIKRDIEGSILEDK